jgi:exosome complex RNA-binding protein Csl4
VSNTIITTNRTIEISAIDSDYMMGQGINVESVVFIPGANDDYVDIIENSIETTDPIKVKLISGDGEPRVWYTYQRLQLGFVFANGTFTAGATVIFNIGEIKGQ